MTTQELTTRNQKIVIGGLGGITPVLLNLIAFETGTVLADLDMFTVLGFLTRVIILFYVGGIIAYLNSESDPVKVFQLGIMGPAMITALMNGSNAPPKTLPADAASNVGLSFISAVYAQEHSVVINPMSIKAANQTQGKHLWHVIVGAFLREEDAVAQAKAVHTKGFMATVYPPHTQEGHYHVVIGKQLSYQAAKALRQQAIDGGLPEDTYLWIPPRALGADESTKQKFFKGLLGVQPKDIWFVVAGVHLNQDGVQRHAEEIRALGLEAKIYEPDKDRHYYAVVIGSFLEHAQAKQLRQRAIDKGLPEGTYLWTFSDK